MNLKTAVLLTCIYLAACAPSPDTKVVEKIVPVVTKETEVTGLDSNPSSSEFTIVTSKNYDGEKLYLNFKTNRDDLRIVSVRKSKSPKAGETSSIEEMSVSSATEATDTLESDANDISPWEYTYEFEVTHPSFKEKETITQKILQKKSLIVTKNTKVSDILKGSNEIKLEKLTISKDAILTLDKPSVKLDVENFIAEAGSSIENMTREESEIPAKDSEPGKDGGEIRFHADHATGTLNIFLRGGKGGTGPAGENSTTPGAPGSDGSPGQVKFPRIPRDPIVLSSPRHKKTQVIRTLGYEDGYCHIQPGPGGKGGTGPRGGTGGTGAKGGKTGSMELSINGGSLIYAVEFIPGTGGNGGKGGRGGPGGPPGNPGDTASGTCSAPGNLGQGDEGPEGLQGPKGFDGTFGHFCTFRNDNQFSCVMSPTFTGEL